MEMSELQKQIFENKVKRGFNTTDVGKEIILLAKQLQDFMKNSKNNI